MLFIRYFDTLDNTIKMGDAIYNFDHKELISEPHISVTLKRQDTVVCQKLSHKNVETAKCHTSESL
jgi:hypothetical protein